MKLNKEQYRAAHHKDGPMLVLAGPGSGKTHLLVERIRIMIEEEHIPPDNILVITFSKKAARQMQARFLHRIDDRSYPVTFGTFHAVFYHILQEHDQNISRLITEQEQRDCIKTVLRSFEHLSAVWTQEESADMILGMITEYKNLGEDMYARNRFAAALDIEEQEEFVKIYERYDAMVRFLGLIDFDDMLIRCLQLFRKHESILRKWQNKYRYILVDEFQDINSVQYDVLRLLAGDSRNVFAVGDDDQSIYAFRGARPELMKKFIHQFVGCRQIVLSVNYRCSEMIIGASDTLIRNNTDRIQRDKQEHIQSHSGGYVYSVHSESTDVQAAFVCDTIIHLMEECSYGYHDFAVLYRSDHCAARFRHIAKDYGLPLWSVDRKDGVSLMTAHASKGLEFTCVFIIGLQEGLFPHHLSMNANIEEERRLMYVAMTRAKQRLYLCALGTKHGKRDSRFISEATRRKKYITDTLRLKR